MQLPDLVDDCLQLIFSLLDLKDQISLGRVCARLEKVASDMWRMQHKSVCINFWEIPLSDTEFNMFLRNICGFVEILRIKGLTTPTQFHILGSHQYSKLIDFRFQVEKLSSVNDQNILELVESMPNLRTFSPQGNLTGRHIDQMARLQNLNLTNCKLVDLSQVEAILGNLDLKTLELCSFKELNSISARLPAHFKSFRSLEELHLDEDWIYLLMWNLPDMRHLRRLQIKAINFYAWVDLFDQLAKCDRKVDSITFSSRSKGMLKRLASTGDIVNISEEALGRVCSDLRELHLFAADLNLLELLLPRCPRLALINLQSVETPKRLNRGLAAAVESSSVRIVLYPDCEWDGGKFSEHLGASVEERSIPSAENGYHNITFDFK